MAEQGITLYCIGCEPSLTPYRDRFMAFAHITGGQYCPLGNASALSTVIVGGAREEIALEGLMDDVAALSSDATVQALSEERRAEHVWSQLKAKNVVTRQLRMGASDLPAPSSEAITMSKATTLAEARTSLKPAAAPLLTRVSSMVCRAAPKKSSMLSMFSSARGPDAAAAPVMESTAASSPAEYAVAEAEISMAQVSRMMKKRSAARSAHS